MRRIYSETEKKVIELWFLGAPRDGIARKLHISGSTVSSITRSLPECLQQLRDLSVEIRKNRSSASEALKGAKLFSKLAQLGTGLGQGPGFILSVRKLSRKAEYEPDKVMHEAMQLNSLEEQSGKSYSEVMREFEAKHKQIVELTKKNSELQREMERKEEQRAQKLRQCRVTEEQLKNFEEVQQTLGRNHISLADVKDLKKYLENIRKTGGHPGNFVKFTRTFGSLARACDVFVADCKLEPR
jgi:chromosome segregation ATPase